jgi:ABC-type multidrug transport system ATPase subunit
VAVLSHGRLLALASPDDLRQTALQQMAGGWAVLDVEAATLSREDVRALLGLPSVQGMVRVLHPGGLRLAVNDVASATVEIIQALQDRGVQVASVEPYTPTFDEVFMRIVGNGR